VQEFNGLVSIKGQRKLALFTFYETPFFTRFFSLLPLHSAGVFLLPDLLRSVTFTE
jgi:hypothetical protein